METIAITTYYGLSCHVRTADYEAGRSAIPITDERGRYLSEVEPYRPHAQRHVYRPDIVGVSRRG